MGKLPNFDNAHVGIEKLTEYCLNEHHPYGKEKALVFKSALGIGINDANKLKEEIIRNISKVNCIERESDEYGKRYTVIIKIRIFDKEADVVTGWIIRKSEDFPRLTSCYVKK
ncbi:MAG: hypothetical protein SFY32_08740 [Bacteroidota bacterium]|nr:hypothetical protein [Bacteroidota bacterium]